MSSRVTTNTRPLQKFREGIRREIETAGPDDMFTSWGRRYLAFLRERFRANRAGGGEWAPLAKSTLAKKTPRLGILYVTGAIFNALRPGQPGNLFQRIRNGIRVGIGGGAKHPGSDKTIVQIATLQNEGTRHIPSRKIIVPPDAVLKRLMREDAKRMMQRQLQNSAKS